MTARSFAVAAALCAAALVVVVPGAAQAKPVDYEAAKNHFDEGTKAFNLGEFKKAIEEYKAAYNAKPDPVFLYNIAQSYRMANDTAQAVFFYRSYLRNAPSAPNRREVEERVRKLEAQLALQRQVTTEPPNTPVRPTGMGENGEPRATTTTTATEPATTEPATTSTSSTTSSSSSLAVTATPSEKKPLYKKWWLWTIVGGVVVVGLGVGLGVGLSQRDTPPSAAFGPFDVF